MAMINNVNHKNMIIMWNFLKGYAKEKGLPDQDINIFEMLKLPFPENYASGLSYYTDPTQWSTLETYVQCYLKTKEVTGDPDTFRNCGRSAAKYKSFSNWKEITKSVSGPIAAINHLPNVILDWNDTKILELVEPAHFNFSEQRVKATIRYTFHSHIDPCDDYCSDPHILGIFEAVPTNYPKHIWKPWVSLPLGNAKQTLVQYDPIKLFSGVFFEHLDLRPVFDGNSLYLRHPVEDREIEIGKKVILLPSEVSGKEVFLGRYKDITDRINENDTVGTLISETIEVEGEPVCQAGVIMEAPYFIINYSCEELAVTRKIWSLRSFFKGRQDVLNEFLKAKEALRQEIEEKNRAYAKLEDHAIHLEDMVEERTAELKETQTKLIKAEKQALEHRITGGFAHEMRNALAGAQLEFRTTLKYKDKGKSSSEILKDSATSLLKNISQIHEEFGIPREKIATHLIPELKTIAEIADHLSGTISGVSKDIDRGLQITNQIRDYAKMSELKPGRDEVNLTDVLREYKDRYSRDFESHNINCLVEGPENIIIRADELHINSIFSNLILNARDALVEQGSTDGKISISAETNDGQIAVKVQDNGPGIPDEHINEIFEPFFSTKPTSGTGLGLGIVKRLVQLYDGEIDVESKASEGTTFTITLPN